MGWWNMPHSQSSPQTRRNAPAASGYLSSSGDSNLNAYLTAGPPVPHAGAQRAALLQHMERVQRLANPWQGDGSDLATRLQQVPSRVLPPFPSRSRAPPSTAPGYALSQGELIRLATSGLELPPPPPPPLSTPQLSLQTLHLRALLLQQQREQGGFGAL